MPGHDDAVLTLVSETDADATFAVEFIGHKNVNRYNLWVQNDGLNSDGNTVSRGEAAVSTWSVGTSTVTVPKGGVTEGQTVAGFSAYVWLFPDNGTPVSNTVMF